jgi:hypothetical protein
VRRGPIAGRAAMSDKQEFADGHEVSSNFQNDTSRLIEAGRLPFVKTERIVLHNLVEGER